MQSLRYAWVWWTLGWLLVAGVSVGSLLPSGLAPTLPVRDKLVHAGAYFLLMIWFSGLYTRRQHFVVALSLLLFGLVLDIAQSASPGRSFDLADVGANAAGILFGWLLARYLLEGWCLRLERIFFSR